MTAPLAPYPQRSYYATALTTADFKTVLHPVHLELGARMVPFGGWDMPVQYSGILAEVKAVRTAAGLFDVSHMGRLYISGPRSTQFLDWVLTGSADTLRVGRARYCMICNESGGVIDATIVYRLAEDRYLLIPNAGNRLAVVEWFESWIENRFSGMPGSDPAVSPAVSMVDRTESTALIACQGPGAARIMDSLCEDAASSVRPFAWKEVNLAGKPVMIGRTGYTGEDGFEIVAQARDAALIWNSLMEKGALPCGLGARDVLRLEAGLPLHGHEIDQGTTPIEAGLSRFVRFDKEYVGSAALAQQNEAGTERKLVGLTVAGRSAPRAEYSILHRGEIIGRVTSGSYSPTLDTSIAMGYVLGRHASPGHVVDLDIRGRTVSAKIVALPFYTRSK